MFISAVLILGVWQGALATDNVCEDVMETCSNFFGISLDDLPETESDIESLCPNALQHLDCIKDFEDQCGIENVRIYGYSREKIDRLIDLTNDICQKDSQLHIDLVENLDCLKIQVDKIGSIRNKIMDRVEKTENYIQEMEKEDSEIDVWFNYQCLFSAMEYVHFDYEILDNCGKRADDASKQIIMRAELFDEICPKEFREGSAELLKTLELEMEEERDVRNMLLNN
ncbi:uncharacterized protein CDAR_427301 [Caerostris darwini]|uniref:Uncharacterized protein n=1 Tax=Caerostris darwini TaxID=1538125 RepID=A0AAV4PII8_9ARAC|nr:uncharacterized protein CDAR_427301 [Caerostris darwini]